MLKLDNVSASYGSVPAISNVSIEIGEGEAVGLLGANGAGKSTTLRVLAGFLGPTAGTVTIAGHDVVTDSFEARRCVGYMPESVPLYPEMRVVEYLSFRAELKQVTPNLQVLDFDGRVEDTEDPTAQLGTPFVIERFWGSSEVDD